PDSGPQHGPRRGRPVLGAVPGVSQLRQPGDGPRHVKKNLADDSCEKPDGSDRRRHFGRGPVPRELLRSPRPDRSRTRPACGAGPAAGGGATGLYGLQLKRNRIAGLSANAGRITRPWDEPTGPHFVGNGDFSLAPAFPRREELRKQRWIIRNVELQLRAAKNL